MSDPWEKHAFGLSPWHGLDEAETPGQQEIVLVWDSKVRAIRMAQYTGGTFLIVGFPAYSWMAITHWMPLPGPPPEST